MFDIFFEEFEKEKKLIDKDIENLENLEVESNEKDLIFKNIDILIEEIKRKKRSLLKNG